MKRTYILSLILFLVIAVFAMIMSGCFLCYFDIPSLIMVLGSAFVMLIATHSPAEIGKNFSLGFKNEAVNPAELKSGIVFFKALRNYLFLGGATGAFIGLIAMLALLDDPDKIGAGMALCLTTLLYSIAFNVILVVPFKTGLEKKLAEAENI